MMADSDELLADELAAGGDSAEDLDDDLADSGRQEYASAGDYAGKIADGGQYAGGGEYARQYAGEHASADAEYGSSSMAWRKALSAQLKHLRAN